MASRAPAILASTRVAHESQNARSASLGGSSQSFVRGSPPSALLLKSSGASTPDYAHSAPAVSPRFANFCVRVCPSNQPYRGASAVAVRRILRFEQREWRCPTSPYRVAVRGRGSMCRRAPAHRSVCKTEHSFYSLMAETLEIDTGAPRGTVDLGSCAMANAVAWESC